MPDRFVGEAAASANVIVERTPGTDMLEMYGKLRPECLLTWRLLVRILRAPSAVAAASSAVAAPSAVASSAFFRPTFGVQLHVYEHF
jgi:hypothetical protein